MKSVFTKLISIVFIVSILTGCAKNENKRSYNYDELDSHGRNIKYLTQDVPTILYMLGDDIIFWDDTMMDYSAHGLDMVPVIKLQDLSARNLEPDSRAQHYALIINDRNETVSLTEEDIAYIKELVNTTQYSFIYLGRRYNELFCKHEIALPGVSNFYAGFYQRQYVVAAGVVEDIVFGGNFTPAEPGVCILEAIAFHVRSCR